MSHLSIPGKFTMAWRVRNVSDIDTAEFKNYAENYTEMIGIKLSD
jgi:hypothetical protein